MVKFPPGLIKLHLNTPIPAPITIWFRQLLLHNHPGAYEPTMVCPLWILMATIVLETERGLVATDGPDLSHSSFFIVAYIDSVDSETDSLFGLRGSDNDFQFDAGHPTDFYARMSCNPAFGTSTYFSNGTDLKGKPLLISILGSNGMSVRINGVIKGNLT